MVGGHNNLNNLNFLRNFSHSDNYLSVSGMEKTVSRSSESTFSSTCHWKFGK